MSDEAKRVQEIADQYRITSTDRRVLLREFVVWLAQNGYEICDDVDLIPTRHIIEGLIPQFLEEQSNDNN